MAENKYAFITAAHGLLVDENVRSSLKVTALFTTSEKAYLSEVQGEQVSTTKSEGAEERSYALAVAASEEVSGGTSKLVWVSGSQMMSDVTNQVVSGGNYEYLQEMVDWMCEREQVITVPALTIEEPMLVVSDAAANPVGCDLYRGHPAADCGRRLYLLAEKETPLNEEKGNFPLCAAGGVGGIVWRLCGRHEIRRRE